MCDILKDRVRINQILANAIDDGFASWSMQADELVQHCVHALQACYHGSCADECMQARAAELVAGHLARREAGAALGSGAISSRPDAPVSPKASSPSAPTQTGR